MPLEFPIANHSYHSCQEQCLLLPSTNSIIFRNLIFKNNQIELYPNKNPKKMQELTLQLIKVGMEREKAGKPDYSARLTGKVINAPSQQTTLKCYLLSRK